MGLTIDDFTGLETNPNAVVYKALHYLEQNGYEVSNADNAFTFLLEYCATLTQSSVIKFKEELRKTFPALASKMSDLYPHLNEDNIPYLFAKPGTVEFVGNVHVMSMKQNAKHIDNYRETVLPVNTVFSYNDINFLTTNDYRIRVFDQTEKVEVVSIPNSSLLSDNTTTILDNVYVTSDGMGNPVLKFPVKCKQVTKTVTTKSILKYESTVIKHTLTDKFYCAEVFIVDNTSKQEVKLNMSYLEDYLDTSNSTVFVKLLENEVVFTLPNIFTKYNNLKGSLKVVVYETKGASFLPMYNIEPADIATNFGTENNLNNDTIRNGSVTFFLECVRDTIFIGGSDPLTFDQIKQKLITNSFKKTLPVTDFDVLGLGNDDGFILSKVEDTLSGRAYIASKTLDGMKSGVMKSIPDVFNNLSKVVLAEYANNFPENISTDLQTFFIPSGTLFKEVSGYVKPVLKDERIEIEGMDYTSKIRYLKENKIFFTPFYYVVNTKKDYSETSIYHLDVPIIKSNLLKALNNNIPNGVSANITAYALKKQTNGYRLYISVVGNSTFDEINFDNVNIQVTMFNKDGIPIYFKMDRNKVDNNNPYFFLDIETDFKISGEQIEILNGDSTLGSKLVDFETSIILHCYITDPARFEETRYLVDEIQEENPNTVVIFKSEMSIKLGEELTYLWNRMYNTYTERKYLKYETDKPKRYQEDVYETDVNGNLVYVLNPNGQELTANKLHSKGDIMQDDAGEPIYEYKAGDVVLQNGEPVVDQMSGVMRNIEMLMLEYEYKVGDDPTSKRILESAIDYIYGLIVTRLPDMNSKLLEKTSIFYRGNKRTLPISANVDGSETRIPFNISPKIRMFVTKETNLDETILETYRKTIGGLLNKYISNNDTIYMKDVVDMIFTTIANDSIKGISIYLFNDEEVNNIVFTGGSDRPIISKKLVYNVSKLYEVEYDIEIEVIRMV